MKRLRRYRKNVVSLVMAIMVLATGIFSTSFDSFASSFSVPYQEPSTSDGQGYIALELENVKTGSRLLNVYAWSVGCFNDTGTHSADYDSLAVGISLSDSVFQIWFEVEDLTTQFDGVVAYYNGSGKTRIVKSSSLATNFTYSYNYATDGDGYKIVGYQFKGNVTTFGETNSLYNFDVPQITWGSEVSMLNVLLQIVQSLNSLNTSLGGKLDSLMEKLHSMWYDFDYVEEFLINIRDDLQYYLPAIDYELDSIDEELDRIYAKIDALLEEQKKSNTWLERIWDSIQEFINPKSSDKNKTDEFQLESESQKNEIDDLNEQNQTAKVDVNNAVSNVDANINYDDMAQYGGVLATITNNDYILQLILVVVSIAIIAYVLFGKR